MPAYYKLPGTFKDPATGVITPVTVKISIFSVLNKDLSITTTRKVESIQPRTDTDFSDLVLDGIDAFKAGNDGAARKCFHQMNEEERDQYVTATRELAANRED